MKQFIKIHKIKLFLALLIIIGSVLRFYNLNWDNGYSFHPDERNIAMAVSQISFFDQLNPNFFAYGGFSIYLTRLGAEFMNFITKDTGWVSDWERINLVGRFFSALFSTLTLIPLFFLAKKMFGKETALASVILGSLTVSFIQSSHFATTESFLVLTIVSLCLLSLKLLEKPILKNYLTSGFVLGLAIAGKTTALSYIILLLTAFLLIIISRKYSFKRNAFYFVLALIVSFFTFSIFSPYTFISFNKFLESMKYESAVVTGSLPVVYTLQFTKTIPYLFQLQNLFWQLGILTMPAILGILMLIKSLVSKKNKKVLLFLIFPIIYFLYTGSWHTKFIRYSSPLLPFFVISSAYMLTLFLKKNKLINLLILSFFLILTLSWSLAFFSIYTHEQTRITASKWIYRNIPQQSKILEEHWDDGLPIQLPSFFNHSYNIKQLTIYEPDNFEKLKYYSQELSGADYIIINSRRLYGTLINLPEKYPLTSKYYRLLFEEKIGYKKIAHFTSYPKLFFWEINDDSSEETFQVYDHPKVLIFKNIAHFNQEDYLDILKID